MKPKGPKTFDIDKVDSFPVGENAFSQNGKLWPSKGMAKVKKTNEFYNVYFQKDYKDRRNNPIRKTNMRSPRIPKGPSSK